MIDIKKILSKLTAQTEKKTLLWTNPNPSSAFSAQTTAISNLSLYDEIEVYFLNADGQYDGGGKKLYQKGKVGEPSVLCCSNFVLGGDVGSRTCSTNRGFSFSGNNIVWKNGQRTLVSGGVFSTGADNSACIPLKIYGIKWGGTGLI